MQQYLKDEVSNAGSPVEILPEAWKILDEQHAASTGLSAIECLEGLKQSRQRGGDCAFGPRLASTRSPLLVNEARLKRILLYGARHTLIF